MRGCVVGGCAGSVQKCAFEGGFHPGVVVGWVCAGWGLGGRAESVQDVRLRPDSTRVVGLRPV